jgi:hypothetical protein
MDCVGLIGFNHAVERVQNTLRVCPSVAFFLREKAAHMTRVIVVQQWDRMPHCSNTQLRKNGKVIIGALLCDNYTGL